MSTRQPIVPLTDEQRKKLLSLSGYVLIGMEPGQNSYQGFVEHSFSMGWSKSHVNFFWTGKANSIIGQVDVDGRRDVDHYLKEESFHNPDWKIEVWDAHDPNLPIELDWEAWVRFNAYDPNTLSGVSDKFRARNLSFKMKDM